MKSLDYIRANGKQGLGAIIGMTGATAAKIAGAAESFRVRVLLVDVEGCCSSAAVWGGGRVDGGGGRAGGGEEGVVHAREEEEGCLFSVPACEKWEGGERRGERGRGK